MQSVSNIAPQANLPYLKDDCDRASSIVGFDINNYVFGDEFSKAQPQNTSPQGGLPSNAPHSAFLKKEGSLGAAIGLLGITAGAIALAKKSGKLSNSKILNAIKEGAGKIIAKFKKS